MASRSTNTANQSDIRDWLTGTPGFNIRKGLSPVSLAKSAGTATRMALTTKLGLASVGFMMYEGMSPQRAMYETVVSGSAFIAGARIGAGVGRAVTERVAGRGARFAEDVARGAGRPLAAGSKIYSASKYAGMAGTIAGGAMGAIALAAGASMMYDVVASAPRKMIERGRRLREMEMGGNFHDPFGTAYTMRQRSLQGIQKSHINARNALGNEAYYSHVR